MSSESSSPVGCLKVLGLFSVGLIVLFGGFFLAVVMLFRNAPDQSHITAYGEATIHDAVERGRGYQVSYSYPAEGQVWLGNVQLDRVHWRPGNTISVRFDPDNPADHCANTSCTEATPVGSAR